MGGGYQEIYTHVENLAIIYRSFWNQDHKNEDGERTDLPNFARSILLLVVIDITTKSPY